jgi:hypothetical protein
MVATVLESLHKRTQGIIEGDGYTVNREKCSTSRRITKKQKKTAKSIRPIGYAILYSY